MPYPAPVVTMCETRAVQIAEKSEHTDKDDTGDELPRVSADDCCHGLYLGRCRLILEMGNVLEFPTNS